MNDTVAYTQSILDIVAAVDKNRIMLPEFQRDFRWEIELSYELFDSLARDIFIGTIIYGKPSFGLSVREIDTRPRRKKGKRRKEIETLHITDEEMNQRVQIEDFKIVLDGQQRITSIYRATCGIDNIYLIASNHVDSPESLEQLIASDSIGFGGEDLEDKLCVKVHNIYQAYKENGWREKHWQEKFYNTAYVRANSHDWDEKRLDTEFDRFLTATQLLLDLLKREKLVSYYLLDMGVDKFSMFFERSNSRLIRLNFTDILAAKLYSGFNLREKTSDFEARYPDIEFNRELIVRAISYYVSNGEKVDKNYILRNLKPEDFQQHWDYVCDLYVRSLNYLYNNYFILSQKWMPSENMLLPLMVFLDEVGETMNEYQRRFIEFWFWASTFATRYSTATNETIVADAGVLTKVARNESIQNPFYLRGLRPRISQVEDILSQRKKASMIYKGLLNLINYHNKGLLDWSSQNRLDFNNQNLQDHHIFPKSFILNNKKYRHSIEAEDLLDCVANRALIPRITNIRIGAKAPSIYLKELAQKNPDLPTCLQSHLINLEILDEGSDTNFEELTYERAEQMFNLLEHYAIAPYSEFSETLVVSRERAIDIFADYKKHSLQAKFFPNTKEIEFEGHRGSVTTITEIAVSSIGGPKRAPNGWVFWKFVDDGGDEVEIDNLRS
jgi:hypothetical protein